MNLETLKNINRDNHLMVYINDTEDFDNDDLQYLFDYNIDVYCQAHNTINSIAGVQKIQMCCDAVLMPNDRYHSSVVAFADVIGQPVYCLENYDNIAVLCEDLISCNKYPSQFFTMRMLQSAMYFLHVDKNKDYSPSNIMGTGQAGIATRLWDKCARYMNLIGFDIKTGEYTAEKQPKNESILDTLIDMANYALIGIIHRFGKWGK
jgi:hypothetical protein